MITSEDALSRLADAESRGEVSSAARKNIERWLKEAPFEQYRARLFEDIEHGRFKELDDAFYAVLEFGTGGRRGKMYPVGTNVLNDRTIAESARGLADYVTARRRRTITAVMRDRPRYAAPFGGFCQALRECSPPPVSKSFSSRSRAQPPCSRARSVISAATRAS